jgi:hypothetical protein
MSKLWTIQEESISPKGSKSPKTRSSPKGSISPKTRSSPRGSISPKTRSSPRGSKSPKSRSSPRGSKSPKSRSSLKYATPTIRKKVGFRSLSKSDKNFFTQKFMDDVIGLSKMLMRNIQDILEYRRKYKKSIFSNKKRKYSQKLLESSQDFNKNLITFAKKHISFKNKYVDPMHQNNGGGIFGRKSATEQDLNKLIKSFESLIDVFNNTKERFWEYPNMVNKENITNIYNTSFSVLFRSNVSLQETIIPMLQKYKIA